MRFTRSKHPVSILVYALLTGVLFGGIFTGYVLGIATLYTRILAITTTILGAIGAMFVYLKRDGFQFFTIFERSTGHEQRQRLLELAFYLAGIVLLVLMITPLVRWPYSYISETLEWDAGAYHFPKAIELYRTGTIWDLSIPYGQYPHGYESLLSLALSISADTTYFGSMHAIITLYLFFTLWFLARRYTRINPGALFFLTALLLISGRITFSLNPWAAFSKGIFTIGKNDLFLGAAILASILHAPIDHREDRPKFHLYGFALNGMIALSIKPNSALVVALVGIVIAYEIWRRSISLQRPIPWRQIALAFLILLPGILWVVRNLIVMNVLFSEGVVRLQERSIIRNLTNPFFYKHITRKFIGVLTIILFSVIGSSWKRKPHWSITLTFILLLFSFVITPATAFHSNLEVPSVIDWRFGIALLGFAYLVPMVWLNGIIINALRFITSRRALVGVSASIIVAATVWITWSNQRLLQTNKGNVIVVQDQFRESVGVDGYHSAYDYIHRNLRDAVIRVENGLVYYVYGPDFSNHPTKQQYPLGREDTVPQLEPEYFLIFQTAWWGGEDSYPDYIDEEDFTNLWELIYEDSQGRIYKVIEQSNS